MVTECVCIGLREGSFKNSLTFAKLVRSLTIYTFNCMVLLTSKDKSGILLQPCSVIHNNVPDFLARK